MRTPLLLLLALAFFVKAAALHQFEAREPLADAPFGDSVIYLEEAKRHFEERVDAPFYKPPAYSLLLHLCGADRADGRDLVRRVQLALGLFVVAGAFVLARRRGGALAGAVAGLACIAYAPLTFGETKLEDGTLALALSVAACVAYDGARARRGSLLAGMLVGLSATARAANLALVPAFAALELRRGGTARAALILLGAALPVLPVAIHNRLHGAHEWIPINYSEGHTFLVGNHEGARGIYDLPPGYEDGVVHERLRERDLAAQALGREPTAAEQRDHSYREGLDWLAHHAGAIPALLLAKARFAVSSVEVSDNYSLARERERVPALRWLALSMPALLILGALGLGLRSARPRAPLLAPVLLTLALLLAFYVTSRYRVVAAPFLAVAAGVAVAAIRARPPRGEVLGALVAPAVVLALLLSPLPIERAALEASERSFDLIQDVHAARTLAAGIAADVDRARLERSLRTLIEESPPERRPLLARSAIDAAGGDSRVAGLVR